MLQSLQREYQQYSERPFCEEAVWGDAQIRPDHQEDGEAVEENPDDEDKHGNKVGECGGSDDGVNNDGNNEDRKVKDEQGDALRRVKADVWRAIQQQQQKAGQPCKEVCEDREHAAAGQGESGPVALCARGGRRCVRLVAHGRLAA